MTDEALLALVDGAIQDLLGGGAVQSWREGAHLVEHMDILKLYKLKTEIESRIAAANVPMCLPVREINT